MYVDFRGKRTNLTLNGRLLPEAGDWHVCLACVTGMCVWRVCLCSWPQSPHGCVTVFQCSSQSCWMRPDPAWSPRSPLKTSWKVSNPPVCEVAMATLPACQRWAQRPQESSRACQTSASCSLRSLCFPSKTNGNPCGTIRLVSWLWTVVGVAYQQIQFTHKWCRSEWAE